MSQTWTADVFDRAHAHDTDLGNMEANFASLKSLFSGDGAPASMAACHPWFDTTQHVLKVRDDGDAAWLGLMHGDVNQKIWVYRNAALSGWAIDSGVSDKVLAFKGGATYVAGAASAGSWTVSGLTADSHNHKWYDVDPSGNDESYNSAGTAIDISVTTNPSGYVHFDAGSGTTNQPAVDYHTSNTAPTVSSDATWRVAAEVGTLQYLDLV